MTRLPFKLPAGDRSPSRAADGFLGGEYGRTGELDAFAAALRQVLL